MTLQIQNTQKLEQRYTTWFFHGETGSGKTEAASTFPDPIFIVPKGEGSHVTLEGRDFDFMEVGGTDEMGQALGLLESRYAAARKLWQAGKEDEGFEKFPWQTVVIESLTHYCDIVVEEYTRGGQLLMDQQKWGALSAHLRTVSSRLARLPVHVVYVALSRSITEDKKVTSIEPSFPGSMNEKLPSSCNALVYFERKSGNPSDLFFAHFGRCGKAIARARHQQLTKLGKMRNFNYAEVAKILGLPE